MLASQHFHFLDVDFTRQSSYEYENCCLRVFFSNPLSQ